MVREYVKPKHVVSSRMIHAVTYICVKHKPSLCIINHTMWCIS